MEQPTSEITSHPIRPEWTWTYWDYNAERNIHRILRDELVAKGKPAAWVAGEINRALAGVATYSDNPAYDTHWLERLFEATNEAAGFQVQYLILALDTNTSDYTAVIHRAQRNLNIPAHRAANDLRVFVGAYRLARGD